jgi:hypothetical protein
MTLSGHTSNSIGGDEIQTRYVEGGKSYRREF